MSPDRLIKFRKTNCARVKQSINRKTPEELIEFYKNKYKLELERRKLNPISINRKETILKGDREAGRNRYKQGTISWKARVLRRFKQQVGCSLCGYNKNHASLVFHHIGTKRLKMHPGYSWKKLLLEIDNCIILCHNCHNHIHNKPMNSLVTKRDVVASWKRRVLSKLKEHLGCSSCGKKYNPEILSFHHVNKKRGPVDPNRSWKWIIEEIDNCVIMCHNCHFEFHEKHNGLCAPRKD